MPAGGRQGRVFLLMDIVYGKTIFVEIGADLYYFIENLEMGAFFLCYNVYIVKRKKMWERGCE